MLARTARLMGLHDSASLARLLEPGRPAGAALAVPLIRGPGLPRTAGFYRAGRRMTCTRQQSGPSVT